MTSLFRRMLRLPGGNWFHGQHAPHPSQRTTPHFDFVVHRPSSPPLPQVSRHKENSVKCARSGSACWWGFDIVREMPRKSTVETESLWVPLAARCVCYACGVQLQHAEEKNNCRLCFDVFCAKCFGARRLLPSHYGYTDSQPVCTSCDLLLTSFVMFASQLHRRGAGVLLPPRQAVMVSATNLPLQPNRATSAGGATATSNPRGSVSSSTTAGDEEGFFSKLFSKKKDDSASDRAAQERALSGELDGQQEGIDFGSYSNIPSSSLSNKGMRIDDACWMYMVGWRPLNPNTAIVVGSNNEVYLRLKDIVRVGLPSATTGAPVVPLGNSASAAGSDAPTSPSNAAAKRASITAAQKRQSLLLPPSLQRMADENVFNDGRITLELRGGYYCQLLVGMVHTARGPNSGSSEVQAANAEDSARNENDELRIVDFTSDPTAAKELADRLAGLVKHCKTHFAFSDASLALHVDLCPS